MGFKARLDSLDEVPEDEQVPVRTLYREASEGGGFILDVDATGDWDLQDVGALKRSLENETQRRREARTALEAWEALKVPISDLQKEREELAELRKIDPESEADKIVAKKVEAQLTEMQEKYREQMEAKDAETSKYKSWIENSLVRSVGQQALRDAGGSPELLMPIIERQSRVRWSEDQPVVEVMNEQGAARILDISTGKLMGIVDLVDELKRSPAYGGAFSGANPQGAGVPPGTPPRTPTEAKVGGDPKHRGDFADRAAKSKWIHENGLDSFMALPMPPKG
jgi:hypothetical protein